MTNHHGSEVHHQQGDVWIQWFACCFSTQQPHHPGKRRPMRIDRSMIGLPTNFQHTGHIGCNDLGANTGHMAALHTQLQSKGGYNAALPISSATSAACLLDTRPLLPISGGNVSVMRSSQSSNSPVAVAMAISGRGQLNSVGGLDSGTRNGLGNGNGGGISLARSRN